MTKEEFSQLSQYDKEDFINEGGVISPDSSAGELLIPSPHVDSQVETEQVAGADVVPSATSVVEPLVITDSTQPAPDNLHPEYQEGFDIQDPLELLMLLDDDVKNGIIQLHNWQIGFLLDFAKGGISDSFPFQAIVRACNGSGKDKYVIAPCVVWLCMRYRLARGIVTSSSGVQLDNQTEAYIEQLCVSANRKFAGGKEEIWKCNYRYYYCIPTESPIILFATDEAGKAEGYHPLGSGRKMGIFQSEDKTIPDEINTALNRCTGYTHRAHVSTPGLPMGHFFDIDSTAISRDTIKDILKDISPGEYIQYFIDYRKCSHIKEFYAEQVARDTPGGKNSPVWKSQFLAEFGTTDEMVVIPYTYVWRSFINNKDHPYPKWIPEPYNKGGLDLSDGGDETVLTVRNGNKHLVTIPFKFDNTEDSIEFLDEKFKEWNLNFPEAYIFADVGGMGKPMLDRLKRMGWNNIRYIDNRSPSRYPKTYLNRGTDLWFNIRQLMERHELIVLKDDKLVRQLSTRYYKIDLNNRHRLLSKIESRSRGYPSPDRGDSFTLAFWDYRSTFVETTVTTKPDSGPFKMPPPTKPVGDFTLKNWAKGSDDMQTYVNQRTGGRKDMSRVQGLIDEYNKQLKLRKLVNV